MGFFNLLETFFFISLAITFVLIMMLVYHFKGRILILEQKCDTMFEIMNNMVKEMKNIKYNSAAAAVNYPSPIINGFNPGTILPTNESIFISHNQILGKDKADEYIDSESEESGSEESDSDESQTDTEYDKPEFTKIVVSDNEEETPVKIINIDMNDTSDIHFDLVDTAVDVNTSEESESINAHDAIEEIVELQEEPITVNKMDIDFSASESNNEIFEKPEFIDYKKMDVSYLRTMVITRGLASDTKKLKKPDLIRLLEEAEREVIKQEE
jgi:hypothetical protein